MASGKQLHKSHAVGKFDTYFYRVSIFIVIGYMRIYYTLQISWHIIMYLMYIYLFQIITRIVFFGGLFTSSNGSDFLLVNDWRMVRHQYSADKSKINRTETDNRESTKNK